MTINNDCYWILPNRTQNEEEQVVRGDKIVNLSSVIDVKDLPQTITLGIPEGVLRRHPEHDLIYSQFCRQRKGNRDVFVLSVKCGVDKNNRSVYLTIIKFVAQSVMPDILHLLPPTALPAFEKTMANDLIQRLHKNRNQWAESVVNMLENVRSHSEITSFANIENPDAFYPVQNTPSSNRRKLILNLVLSILIGIGACLFLFNLIRSIK